MQTGSLGRRIAIFGGGGKTTLASAIARKFDVPHIELDAIKHGPNWVERPEDEFARIVEQRLDESSEGWVTDGNYQRIRSLILAPADTVVVIQMRFSVMFWRILKGSIHRARSGEPLWNLNKETWRMTFASRESILLEHVANKDRSVATVKHVVSLMRLVNGEEASQGGTR